MMPAPITYFAITIASVALLCGYMKNIPRVELPEHMLHHKAHFVPDMISPDAGKRLIKLLYKMGEFPSNANDLKFYETKYEHIGEAEPFHGTCDHPFLVPNINKTHCILPGRIDIARHFLMYGGVAGRKENLQTMSSRLQSFGRYMFDLTDLDVVRELFATEEFQSAARSVCPTDRQFLDPFQFNFIIQVPGQSVALHVDGIYFWGASRFVFPQWLLAVMSFSGLWNDKFVNQVQVVGYVHQWTDDREGNFVYWDENIEEPKVVPPQPLAGSAIDGSKTVHAAKIYAPNAYIPFIDKSATVRLNHVGDDRWQIFSNDKPIANYTTDDLRISIVYRAKCFKDAEERDRYNNQPKESMMDLDEVLGALIKDMVKKGALKSEKQGWDMKRLDLAVKLLDTYIKYPLPPSSIVIPFNYCAAAKLCPALAPVLNLIC
eukprot:TRINITY_DN21244_c0_g1_i1.p1 TRINITY_DN21244_c0_g1~~TRINITY_DN21244_c0_g1_i1.p1  ORF type:complete len:432 (+),score=33.61 TRINITY_DN21244_c0_g1_i1:30-1325(+)